MSEPLNYDIRESPVTFSTHLQGELLICRGHIWATVTQFSNSIILVPACLPDVWLVLWGSPIWMPCHASDESASPHLPLIHTSSDTYQGSKCTATAFRWQRVPRLSDVRYRIHDLWLVKCNWIIRKKSFVIKTISTKWEISDITLPMPCACFICVLTACMPWEKSNQSFVCYNPFLKADSSQRKGIPSGLLMQ